MTTIAALAAAGLLARLCAAAEPSAIAAGGVQIQGNVTAEVATGRLLIRDGAILRRGDVVLRARTASYDPATGEVRATGGVLLTDPTRVVAADAVIAVLGGEVQAERVVAFVKDAPVDLGSAVDLEVARRLGRNRLSFEGARLTGDATGRFHLSEARLTLCDCGGAAPSWEVTARGADVRAGQRAILKWAVLRVTPRFLFIDRPVPVLALPWLYVPLAERRSGLLFPEIRRTIATGLTLSEPIFITLGRSADATVTPEYAFGRNRSDLDKPGGAVRGPGARLELRWAPAEHAVGRAELSMVHDLDTEEPPPGTKLRIGEGGNRWALIGDHAQRISDRTNLNVAVRLSGDPFWVRDMAPDVVQRDTTYRRSDLLVSSRTDELVVEGGAAWLEALRPAGEEPEERFGTVGAALGQANRWPGAAATLVRDEAGPLRLSGRLGATRYAPLSGAHDAIGRPAVTRADARAEVELPLLLGGALAFAPYLRGAATGYAFEAASDPSASTWGIAGAALATEISRRFGEIRHSVAPRLEWRAGTRAAGDALSVPAYDLFDRTAVSALSAAPPDAFQQLRASVETRLSIAARDVVRVIVGQDVDLRRGRFAETFASGAVAAGPLMLDVGARRFAIDGRGDATTPPPIPSPFLDRFTELHASLALADRRGDSLHAGFSSVGAGGSGNLLAGLEPLFDVRVVPGATSAAAGSATLGAQGTFGAATLGYDASFYGRPQLVQSCTGTGDMRRVEGWQAREHKGTFVWSSPCRCFRLSAMLGVDDCRNPSYHVAIDLGGVAEAARLH